jgi:tetratricopeptide (TPR) repeat protein
MKALFTTISLTVFISFKALCQMPVPEFFEGLKLVSTNKPEAKKNFLIALKIDPQFHGTYHFLGAIYMAANNLDSAGWYFNKAIALNPGNVNHTKELTYLRLINNYTYQQDFKNGFSTAWECVKLYPDNKNILVALKDLCLWAFYIKTAHINPTYLSQAIKPEYLVNNIAQEYMIIRKIRVDDDAPMVGNVATQMKNGGNYDIIDCTLPVTKKTITLNFKLNWDMAKDFGGKTPPTQSILSDIKSTIYEKAGAMLAADDKIDIKSTIEKLMN